MHLRTLTPQDAPAFQALRLRGLKERPEAFASSHEEEADRPLSLVAQRLQARPQAAVFGAFDGGTLVAVVGLRRETAAKLTHKANLWGLYVAPEAQGRGVGARLLRHALDHAATVMVVRQVNLGANAQNTAAIALYQKLGFVAYGREPGALMIDGVLQDECLMACRLAQAAPAAPAAPTSPPGRPGRPAPSAG